MNKNQIWAINYNLREKQKAKNIGYLKSVELVYPDGAIVDGLTFKAVKGIRSYGNAVNAIKAIKESDGIIVRNKGE